MNRQNLDLKLFTIACITGLLVIGLNITPSLNIPPSFAQTARPQDLGQQVYKKLPNLPLENKYISKDTGKIDPNNTLVSRLLQYHLYVKGRPPGYRLDWKLTLADYLGVNELIEEASYPGNATLKNNPLEGDRAAITRLNRKQRDDLVQALISLFEQTSRTPINSTSPGANSSPPASQSTSPPPPRPGDAQRLKL